MGKFFSFSGRIGRYEYWIWSLGVLLGWFGLPFVATILAAWILIPFGYVVLMFVNLSIIVRRWHDVNKSGVWVLLIFIPIVGPIWAFIELGFIEGTVGPNNYGWPYGETPTSLSHGYPAGVAPMWTAPAYQTISVQVPMPRAQSDVSSAKRICRACGDANEADNRFCGKCGARMQAPVVQPGEAWNPSRI